MRESSAGIFVRHETMERLRRHPVTSHTEHGLMFLVGGWARLEYGVPLQVEAGTLTVVPAGVPHRPLEGQGMEYWLVGFCASCLKLDEGQILMSPFRRVRHGALPVVALSKARRRRLLRLCRELRDESERTAPESFELARSLLQIMLGEIRRAMPGAEIHASEGSLVADTLEFIQRRCLEPISLRDVAAAVHRTPAHLTATIKQKTGYSVGEWISAGRIAEAASRLAHTDESLEEIAGRVGWQDTTHLIRQFRKARGVTPAVWRRRYLDKHRRDPCK